MSHVICIRLHLGQVSVHVRDSLQSIVSQIVPLNVINTIIIIIIITLIIIITSTKTECDYLNGWNKKRSHTQKSHPKVVNPRDIAGERKKKKKKKKKKKIIIIVIISSIISIIITITLIFLGYFYYSYLYYHYYLNVYGEFASNA